jgi:hypothetical protein
MFQYHCPINKIFDDVIDETCILVIHFVHDIVNLVLAVVLEARIMRVFNYYKYILSVTVQ